ncbi:MAG: hypothetical protein AVDCRST_MAG91-2097, partial [uncultured Sphingomonadaceae bacterium]
EEISLSGVRRDRRSIDGPGGQRSRNARHHR